MRTPLLFAKDGRFIYASVKIIGSQSIVVVLSGSAERRRTGLEEKTLKIGQENFIAFIIQRQEASQAR